MFKKMFKAVMNNKRFVFLFFIELFFLSALELDASSFQPGVSVGSVLNLPLVKSLMNVGAWFIISIFGVSLAVKMFKFVSGGGDVNWLSFLAKFAIIFLLFNQAIPVVTFLTNKVVIKTVSSDTDRINKAFSKLDIALVKLAMGDPEKLDENKKKEKDWDDAIVDTFNDVSRFFSFQTILCIAFSIVAKGMIVLSMITKILMIDIFWPIFFQLTIIGFVFAVPLSSLDGGMEALKKFTISVIEVSLWPVFYNIAFGLGMAGLYKTIDSFVNIVNNPVTNSLKQLNTVVPNPTLSAASASAQILSNLPLMALLLAHLVFLIFLGFLIPLFSRMIVRFEGTGMAASALTYTVGHQLMSMAKGAGAMGGGALMSAGKGMLGMTKKGAQELKDGAGSSAGAGASLGGGSASAGTGGGSAPSTAVPQKEPKGGGSQVVKDLNSAPKSESSPSGGSPNVGGGSAGGRQAHGGKPYFNQSNLTKSENQALQKLGGKNNPEATKEFNALRGMRKDGYNQKAINNQISKINNQFGTNLKTEDKK